MEQRVYDFSLYNAQLNNTPFPHPLSYSEIIDGVGSQIIGKFLVIGLIWLFASYWNRCGMRKPFDEAGNSIFRIIFVNLYKEKAADNIKKANEFLDGLTGSVAIVAIAIWAEYQLRW